MNSRKTTWSKVDKIVAFMVVWLAVFVVLWPGVSSRSLPRLEGQWFPVLEPLKLTSVIDTGMGDVRFSGTINKIRACDFVRIDWWFKKDQGPSVPLRELSGRAVKVRDVGLSDVGPYALAVTPEELEKNVYATVWHNCHNWLPWNTESLYYPVGRLNRKRVLESLNVIHQ